MAVAEVAAGAVRDTARPRSQARRAWGRFRRNRLALASLWFCAAVGALALLAPLLAPYGYAETHYTAIHVRPFHGDYWLGTDELGRDLFSRLLYGLQTAFFIAVGAELLSLLLGIVVGLSAGYLGGRVDQLLMAATDVLFAFPSYLLTVILVTVAGRSAWAILVAIGISSWVGMARLVRAQVLTLKTREFVEAGRAMGASGWTIAVRYILPNAVGPLLVSVSFGIPGAIITTAGLSILGLGVQPPTPSLGGLLQDGMRWVLAMPHMLVSPAVLFALIMLAFTWLGDGLRDAFDIRE